MDIKAITFDYFGTLVDVDKGGMIGMDRVLGHIGLKPSKGIDEIYLDWDITNVRLYRGGGYQRYRDVAQRALAITLDNISPRISKQVDLPLLTDLLLSSLVEDAPPHPEVPGVLAWLASRYPLMPITNMDTDLWQRSQLTQYFEHVTSAEMAKAYKPSSDIFKLALQRLAVPAENVLHCSLASWADIDGAKPLGMNVAWINRGREALGTWQPRPDFEYDDLSSIPNLLENKVPPTLQPRGDIEMKLAFNKALIYASITGLFTVTASAADVTVKIGHSGPLTGPQSVSGKDNERGVRLAIEELNASKLRVGPDTVRFELVSEDDQGDPKQGVSAAQKLIDAGVKAVIGHYNSGVSIPASKLYNDAQVPMITGASSNPKLTQQGFPYVFRLAASDNTMGSMMARFGAGFLKAKKVAVIDDRTSYGTGVADVFISRANELKMQVVGREFTTDKSTDFMSILTKVKALKPDVIFFGGYYPQGGLMARQMKQLEINIPLLGGDGLCAKDIITLSGGAVEGKLFCAQGGTSLDTLPNGTAFRERFKKAFGTDIDVYAPAFYVATLTVAEAMKQAGSTEPTKFVPVLAKTKFSSLLGDVKFDRTGDWEGAPVTVYEVVGGKLEPIRR